MRPVNLIRRDYDHVDQSEWMSSVPALLINQHTLITKDKHFLDIYRSKSPIEVEESSASVINSGFKSAEIELNESAKSVNLLQMADMPVAEFIKYVK